MAVIQAYDDKVAAQGQINSQASPTDFGAELGSSIRQVGEAGMSIAAKMHENDVLDEVTLAHRLSSAKHYEWEQRYIDRANSATPGDRTFAPKLIKDINADMLQAGSQFKTRRAQNVFAELTGKLENSFGSLAIQKQSHLDGEAVKQEFSQTVDDESKLVNGNDLNLKTSLSRVKSMIDDPYSSYSRVSQTVRNELKSLATQTLAVSSVEGYFARDIYAAAKKLLPDQVTEAYATALKPMAETVAAQATKAKAPALAMPPVIAKFSEIIAKHATARGVDPNIMAWQLQAESGGNPNAINNADIRVTGKPSKGLAQFQEGTAKRYGIDPMNPEQAIQGQAHYMSDLLNMFGGDYKKSLAGFNWGEGNVQKAVTKYGDNWIAHAPASTQKYVKSIMANAQQAAPPAADGAAPVTLAPAVAPTDAQGLPIPQLKIPKDASLMPPQGVDIPGWNDLKLDTQQKFMSMLVKDFNSRLTVDRATIADDRKNMEANLLAGNKFDGQAALQAKYASAYGPEMAARMIKEDAVTQELGQFTKGLRGRSMLEIDAAIGQPPRDNATAGEYAAYQRKLEAVKADRAEFQKSPVDYVAKYSSAVQQATQAAAIAAANADKQQTPASAEAAASATQRMITASLAEQRRLGASNPTVLSETAEKQLTQRIQEILGSGRDVAQGIKNLYDSYGSYGETVARQMSKHVGALMNIVGSGIDQDAATLLVEATRNKASYKDTVDAEKLKGLDQVVQRAMADLSSSLSTSPNNASVQAAYQESISTMAMARMSKFGESQKDAVQHSYDALVGKHNRFQDGYRVPSILDAEGIRRQANTVKSQISAADMSLLPGSLGNPEDRMQAQINSIRTYGRWANATQKGADGKDVEGLTLVIPLGGGYDAIPGADGKPIFRSFGELLTAEAGRPTQIGTYDPTRRYDALGRLRNPWADK